MLQLLSCRSCHFYFNIFSFSHSFTYSLHKDRHTTVLGNLGDIRCPVTFVCNLLGKLKQSLVDIYQNDLYDIWLS